jgi:Domain of unknown function (DUF4382)
MLLRKLTSILGLACIVLIQLSCKKENGTTNLKIRLTDNPYNASEVNVDIREIRVNFREDDKGWVNLDTYPGVYNLLGLQNGIDTLIAQGIVPAETLREIRFVLGDSNSITIDNINYPLTIPSGSESGLKIKVNKQLNATIDSLLIDFDAALSILQTGTGEYKLNPVLKIK